MNKISPSNLLLIDTVNPNFSLYFRFMKLLYPFSVTSATTSLNNIASSIFYRLYILLLLIFSTNVIFSQVIIYLKYYFNTLTVLFASMVLWIWCSYTGSVVHSLQLARSEKMTRVLLEIQHLDRVMGYEMKKDALIIRKRYQIWPVVVIVLHILLAIMDLSINYGLPMLLMVLVANVNYMRLCVAAELICLNCFISILSVRIEYFIDYLNNIDNNRVKNVDIVSCYRHIRHLVKRINTIFKYQMFLITCEDFLYNMRLLLIDITKSVVFVPAATCHFLLMCRCLCVLGVLGLAGQRLSELFDRLHCIATKLNDYGPSYIVPSTQRMLAVGGAYTCRLQLLGGLVVDGQLPLKVTAVLFSVVIVLLQLGI